MSGWIKDNAVGLVGVALGGAGFFASWFNGVAEVMPGHEWQIVLLCLAAVVLGFSFGWMARTRRDLRAADKQADETIRRRIESLDVERLRLLESLYVYGVIQVDCESSENFFMKGMASMGLVTGSGGLVWTWHLTGRCRKVLEDIERE